MSLLLLHGAIGSAQQLEPLAGRLREHFDVHTFDFTGHGGKELPAGDFSIELFAKDVLGWMDRHSILTTDIFGYSMGGYVALYLARHYPQRVGKIATLATKFAWDPATAQREVKMLDPAKIREKIPAFAEALAKRHLPVSWEKVLERTAAMMLALGSSPALSEKDFQLITHKAMLSVGDADKMVSMQETETIHRLIRGSSFAILPATPHPIEAVNLEELAHRLFSFFS